MTSHLYQHPFIQKLRDRQPKILSVFLDGIEVLRIENGERTVERSIAASGDYRLLTIHFDGDPEPEYYLPL